jgi:hypothetical protein
LELLNFDQIKETVDSLNYKEGGEFRGFSPRWQLPAKLRNVTDSNRNTSSMLLIIDSRREVELGFSPSFSRQIIGDSEIMVQA